MVITNNKTVLILGCSSDIGVQTARIFLEKKWKVIGHYNKSKKKMVYLQKKYGTQIKLFQLDLSNPKKILTFSKQKLVPIKKIDSFVSLTGYIKSTDFDHINYKSFLDHINVNYYSNLIFIKYIYKKMIFNKWGRILLSSSIGTSFGGGEKTFLYSLSKFNNEFIPKIFRNKYAKYILYNVLKIGVTDTKIHFKIPNKNLKKRINLIPTKRMATTQEVGNKIFSLASEENTLIHGQIINISGGE